MLPKSKVQMVTGSTASSSAWLQRKVGDRYTRLAHEEGLVARSAYKLKQILYDNRDIRGSVIVDLGAAPGGWTTVVQKMFPKSRIIAVDIRNMEYIPNTTQLVMDFTSDEAPLVLAQALAGRKVDILLSDMAPSFSGQRSIDHLRLMTLADAAFDFGVHALRPGGHFIIKVNRGGSEAAYKQKLEFYFDDVQFTKPDASYKNSSETYLVAKNFFGQGGRAAPYRPPPKEDVAILKEQPFGAMADHKDPIDSTPTPETPVIPELTKTDVIENPNKNNKF